MVEEDCTNPNDFQKIVKMDMAAMMKKNKDFLSMKLVIDKAPIAYIVRKRAIAKKSMLKIKCMLHLKL